MIRLRGTVRDGASGTPLLSGSERSGAAPRWVYLHERGLRGGGGGELLVLVETVPLKAADLPGLDVEALREVAAEVS